MRILRADFHGRGKYRVIADALNAIGQLINNLRTEGDLYIKQVGRDLILVGPTVKSSVRFSGSGYAPNGVVTNNLNSDSTKAWVTFSRDTYAFAEAMGPPPTPWPSNEIWFRKAGIAGDLVVVM
jgi:hypothetical protein